MSKLPEKPGLEKNSFILHYRILDKIGEGGGGIVYKAQDTHLDRTVVVKLLKDTLANQPHGKERFLREARLASALDHPNIATIYNIHEYGESYFIVMQFVLGTPLNQILQKKRPELTTSLSIAIQISDALVHAHQKGIIHRDIKPSNIMITAEGQCKILDFGLAKQSAPVESPDSQSAAKQDPDIQETSKENEDVKITHQGTLIGTPLYLSPEMARGESVNEQTDIFSLGIILYQMLTQRLPFGGSNRVEVLHAVTTYSPPPASTFNNKVSPRLDEIIRKALAKKREDRYASMKDFLVDLEEVARDQFHGSGVTPDELPHDFRLSLFKGKAKIPEGNLATKLLGKIFKWSDPDEIHKMGPEESLVALQERRIRSTAVLPFLAVGDDDGTFGLALGDRLSVELSKLGDLAVSPFHSASVLTKEERDPVAIGHELRVQSFLTGTWVKTGSTIRITPQLVRTDRGEIIWSDLFDFKGDSLVEIIDRAAETIGARLKPVFQNQRLRKVREKETENHEAFEAALRGKHMQIKTSFISFNKNDLDLGVRFYREALRLDPEYAKAWGDLGVCYLNYIQRGMGNQTHLDQAEACFDKALKLDASLLEPKIFRVHILLAQGRKELAREQCRLLHRELGNEARLHSVAASLYRWDGLYDSALRQYNLRDQASPVSMAEGYRNRGHIFTYQNKYDLALEEYKKGLEMESHHIGLKAFMAHTLYCKGEIKVAHDLLTEIVAANEHLLIPRLFLAMCLVRLGEPRPARRLIDGEVQAFAKANGEAAYWLGSIYATLLEKDEALKWLKRAVAMGYENYPWFVVDFNLLSLREEEDFLSLLKDLHRKWESLKEEVKDSSMHASEETELKLIHQ